MVENLKQSEIELISGSDGTEPIGLWDDWWWPPGRPPHYEVDGDQSRVSE